MRLGLTALIALASLASLTGAPAPKFSYYLTGNAADVATATEFGVGLMGGGTDVDAVFTWMSDRAGGGDFVVIRASGADGYNQYVYDLGDFDSVETLVLANARRLVGPVRAADHPQRRRAVHRRRRPVRLRRTTGRARRSKTRSTNWPPATCRSAAPARAPRSWASSSTRRSASR